MNKVEITGVNTASLKVLTEAEKSVLLLRAADGDRSAREELVNGNLRLVLSVVQKFAGRSENPDDLFQVGCIGLIKAIDHFDPSFDVRFSTYAVPMIVGEIRRYLRDNSAIRVSRSVRDTAYRVLQCKEQMQLELGRDPSLEEVAQRLGLQRGDVVSAMDAITAPVSLFEPVYADGGDPLMVMDQVRDTRNTDEHWLERIALRDAMGQLGKREKEILTLRFREGKTQMEVAREIGISQAQVSRLEKNALGSIRKAISS